MGQFCFVDLHTKKALEKNWKYDNSSYIVLYRRDKYLVFI